MKARTKIWLGVGAFVLAGTGATGAVSPLATETVSGERGLSALSPDAAMPPGHRPVWLSLSMPAMTRARGVNPKVSPICPPIWLLP